MVDPNVGDAQGNVLVKAVISDLAEKLGLNPLDLYNRVSKVDEGGGTKGGGGVRDWTSKSLVVGLLRAITKSAPFPGAGRELGSLRARMALFLREYSDSYVSCDVQSRMWPNHTFPGLTCGDVWLLAYAHGL